MIDGLDTFHKIETDILFHLTFLKMFMTDIDKFSYAFDGLLSTFIGQNGVLDIGRDVSSFFQ